MAPHKLLRHTNASGTRWLQHLFETHLCQCKLLQAHKHEFCKPVHAAAMPQFMQYIWMMHVFAASTIRHMQTEICRGKQPVKIGSDLPYTKGLVKAAIEHTMIQGISAKTENGCLSTCPQLRTWTCRLSTEVPHSAATRCSLLGRACRHPTSQQAHVHQRVICKPGV